MVGLNRSKRSIELGPYPLERLPRDESILEKEAQRPAKKSLSKPIDSLTPLYKALQAHMQVYEALRLPEPFSKKAPVPDELELRTRDIKGAGYFLDVSQIAIFRVPDSAWLGSIDSGHTHAVVALVRTF